MASIINASTSGAGGLISTADASGELQLQTAGTTRQTIDINGNVGIGTTPTATTATGRRTLEIGKAGSAISVNPSNGNLNVQSNIYTDNAGTNKAVSTGYTPALNLSTGTGNFTFYSGASVSADATAPQTVVAYIEAAGGFAFNSGYGSAAVAYGCRAWVNFNGTGTVAIRASGNVTSITDNGTGRYTVNFTTAMPDTNYSMAGSGQLDTSNSTDNFSVVSYQRTSTASSTSSVAICTVVNGGSWTDCPIVNVNIFR